jgi:hypothetical protein
MQNIMISADIVEQFFITTVTTINTDYNFQFYSPHEILNIKIFVNIVFTEKLYLP